MDWKDGEEESGGGKKESDGGKEQITFILIEINGEDELN